MLTRDNFILSYNGIPYIEARAKANDRERERERERTRERSVQVVDKFKRG
jgi:hypothetical protein